MYSSCPSDDLDVSEQLFDSIINIPSSSQLVDLSNMKRKICVVTGSRAEYGLLYWLLKDLAEAENCDLKLVVTGMHLAPEFGNTVNDIEEDGFFITRKVEMLLSSDSRVGTAKSTALGTIGFAETFNRMNADLIVILGDRFEIFVLRKLRCFLESR